MGINYWRQGKLIVIYIRLSTLLYLSAMVMIAAASLLFLGKGLAGPGDVVYGMFLMLAGAGIATVYVIMHIIIPTVRNVNRDKVMREMMNG